MFGSRAFHPLLRTVTPSWREWAAVSHITIQIAWPDQCYVYDPPSMSGETLAPSGGWEIGLQLELIKIDFGVSVTTSGTIKVYDTNDDVLAEVSDSWTSGVTYSLDIPVTMGDYDLKNVVIELLDGTPIVYRACSITNSVADIVVFSNTCGLFLHEFGKNHVQGDFFYAIQSYITTSNVSLLSMDQPANLWTRFLRIEPDFIQSGNMDMSVITKEYPNSNEVVHGPYTFTNSTERIDPYIQGRLISLKFESNEADGDYQMGKCLLHLEAGDPRS